MHLDVNLNARHPNAKISYCVRWNRSNEVCHNWVEWQKFAFVMQKLSHKEGGCNVSWLIVAIGWLVRLLTTMSLRALVIVVMTINLKSQTTHTNMY